MSYAHDYDEAGNLLIVKFWGEIPYPEEAEAVLTILDDPRIAADVRVLVDRTESGMGSTTQDVRTHARLAAPVHHSTSPVPRWAVT